MAQPSTPAAQATGPAYVADQDYEVTLKRVVEWPAGTGIYYSPRDQQIWKGAVCLENADGILDAHPVQ